MLYYQNLPYIPEIIRIEFISRYHNNLLANYFGIKKKQELIAQKYYWLMLCYDINNYMKRYNICLVSKII